MNCPSCARENPDQAEFCVHCGGPIPINPPSAGAKSDRPSAPPDTPEIAMPPPASGGPSPLLPEQYPVPSQPATRRFPTWGIIAAGSSGLVLCCFVLAVFVGLIGVLPSIANSGKASRPTAPPPSTRPVTPDSTRPQGTQPQGSQPQGSQPQGSQPQGNQPQGNSVPVQILFAKDISPEGKVTDVTDVFSVKDPKIVQLTIWGDGKLSPGTELTVSWFVGGQKAVQQPVKVEGNQGAHVGTVQAPAGGFQPAQVEVQVAISGVLAATRTFTIK